MADPRDQFQRAHDEKAGRHLEKMERQTFDNFRGLGFTKGEALKAANKLGQTVEGSREIFNEKMHRETGVDLSKHY